MKKLQRSIVVLLFCLCAFGAAATNLVYHITFQPAAHYINVELTASDLSSSQTLFKMPVWAPGYYLILDYPKNMVDFQATDASGKNIEWTKVGKNGWLVKNGKQSIIKVAYRIYANAQSVAESMVTADKAFVAPNGVYLYVEKEKQTPVTITFEPASNWTKISTGLDPVTGQNNTFRASDIDNLYDCPVFLGNQRTIDFVLNNRSYQLALETPEGLENTTFVSDIKKMIAEATNLFGDAPYNHYSFLLMGEGRGGLEHINSQASFSDGSFNFDSHAGYIRFLSFVTHEFFHLYNVKSIRPVELGPFDYDREVYTPSLWISEGFTVYYETALLRRAGIISSDEVLNALGEFTKAVEGKEGRHHMSLRTSSYDIWLNFFNRNANGADTRISYYDKGPILGLLMDINIRQLTNNKKSLDDVMRTLYNVYYNQQKRGFTEEEFWSVCAEVAGSPLTDMRRYVDTTCDIDYARYLGYAGLTLGSDLQLHKTSCDGLAKKIQNSIL